MILVDSSVWVDHLRKSDVELTSLLVARLVTMHPMVAGEIACGNLNNRAAILRDVGRLPCALIAKHSEVMQFIESKNLMGKGIGFVDMHLLVATIAGDLKLWTRDKRLKLAAQNLNCAYSRN